MGFPKPGNPFGFKGPLGFALETAHRSSTTKKRASEIKESKRPVDGAQSSKPADPVHEPTSPPPIQHQGFDHADSLMLVAAMVLIPLAAALIWAVL